MEQIQDEKRNLFQHEVIHRYAEKIDRLKSDDVSVEVINYYRLELMRMMASAVDLKSPINARQRKMYENIYKTLD